VIKNTGTILFKQNKLRLYAITLCNFVVPTRSVRYVILFRETGVVHRITYNFSDFLFTYILFIHFILYKINGALYPLKQLDHF